ncbi:MAG: glucosamine-6-phosphate deaminase [Planctomycetes bacterium]|nr:glucosamine-6-phosphate deaminase [Planctomycetota bacterium]
MSNRSEVELTAVERIALADLPFEAIYPPAERIGTIVVSNFPALGKLAALRFIEWVQRNPDGVISLPTGKTPEHFIRWVEHSLQHWDRTDVQSDLEKCGINPADRPDMRGLHFVQIDEFYPIHPWQQNSFFYYVKRYYIDGFGLDPNKALLMDCSKIGPGEGETLASLWPREDVDLTLRYRQAETNLERKQKEALQRIDQWCQEYEEKIRDLGGIGFFLGGIGPDGHIGFNVRGSDHHSTTRLTPTNYETQAAASTDLGGIEIARKRLVITIGLGTITHNPECAAIIIAAGEAKAGVVADAVQNKKHVLYPATALQGLPNARFYVTMGAARLLSERQLHRIAAAESISNALAEKIVVDLAVKSRKRIVDLGPDDFRSDSLASVLSQKSSEPLPDLMPRIHDRLIDRIERGTQTLSGKCFFHTEPHHDDLMLGYLPYIVRHVRDSSNTHYFVCFTSGFTSVTNRHMQDQLACLRQFIDTPDFAALMREGYFDPDNENGRQRDVWQYLDGVAANRTHLRSEGMARRLLRNLIAVYDESDLGQIKNRMTELDSYFETEYPGKKDLAHVQRLKGMCREWEAECLWGYFGWNCSNVMHLRLGFYTGDIFTEEPTVERDVVPILDALKKVQPDVVTVALDPEASGPDTHYKVLQAMAEALRRYEEDTGRSDIKVWGYRNVWYRFHPSEANIYVPVSLNMFSIMRSAFMNAFISQKDASFPSYEYDGPFCDLAQQVQVEQYQKLKACLGREWFNEHPSAITRATRGLVFLKELSLDEFYQHSRELKQAAENR